MRFISASGKHKMENPKKTSQEYGTKIELLFKHINNNTHNFLDHNTLAWKKYKKFALSSDQEPDSLFTKQIRIKLNRNTGLNRRKGLHRISGWQDIRSITAAYPVGKVSGQLVKRKYINFVHSFLNVELKDANISVGHIRTVRNTMSLRQNLVRNIVYFKSFRWYHWFRSISSIFQLFRSDCMIL